MLAVDGLKSSNFPAQNWAYLEGDVEIWVDGTKSIVYTGTEDACLGAFYWGQVKWQTNYVGMTKQHTRTGSSPYYRSCAYRFYHKDVIPFDDSLKIVWHNGEAGGGSPGNFTGGIYSDVWYYED